MLVYMGSGPALAAYYRGRRIQALVACARACDEVARHCLDRLGPGGQDREQLARVRDLALGCQEFCTLTAALMARVSELAPGTFPACAEVCRECAEACEQAESDESLRECGRECRKCEEICRKLAGTVNQHDPFAASPRPS